MSLSLIAAMARNRVIGHAGELPWRMPADLKHFRRLTMGHHILMGRKTYESIGRPLPGRTMVVITRRPDYAAEGVAVAGSLDQALSLARHQGVQAARRDAEIFVVGGGEVFRQAMEQAARIYLTVIDADIEGDTFFPEIPPEEWDEVDREEHAPDGKNAWPYAFVTYERRARA